MQTQLRQAVVVAFGRTPYCKARKGSFAQLHPVEYGAQTLLGVLARVPQLRPEDIGDVIMGCAMPFGVQGGNMARLIVQRAGLPDCVTAQTVNRYCSSGLQTIATAANAIRCGEEDVVIAGGVESMSLVPMLVGVLVSAVVGLLAIKMLQWLLNNDKFHLFGYYCLILGAATIICALVEMAAGQTIPQMLA